MTGLVQTRSNVCVLHFYDLSAFVGSSAASLIRIIKEGNMHSFDNTASWLVGGLGSHRPVQPHHLDGNSYSN